MRGVEEIRPIASRQSGSYLLAKRLMDIGGASILLILLLPVFALIAIAIRLDSAGPALYRGRRIGKDGREFTMFKFRSMLNDADDTIHKRFIKELMTDGSQGNGPGQHMFKLHQDPRVTRVGRILRRTSLDEFPQLLNVLRGEMSLVGPRPELPYALEDYQPWHWQRFQVLPGMTGLWQASGRARLSPLEMLDLDVRYVRECSLLLDIRILFQTIASLLRPEATA